MQEIFFCDFMEFKGTVWFLKLAVTNFKLDEDSNLSPRSLQTFCLPEVIAICISSDVVYWD